MCAVSPGGVLQSFGDFKRDDLAIEKLAELAPAAQKIIDREAIVLEACKAPGSGIESIKAAIAKAAEYH